MIVEYRNYGKFSKMPVPWGYDCLTRLCHKRDGRMREVVIREDCPCIIALINRSGALHVCGWSAFSKKSGMLMTYVDRNFRRLGIGTSLIQKIKQLAARERIKIHPPWSDSSHARAFYRKAL